MRMRDKVRSAARTLSLAIQSRMSSRSRRAVGVNLTLKPEVAPDLLRRDHPLARLRLGDGPLDLGAFPGRVTALPTQVGPRRFIDGRQLRFHGREHSLNLRAPPLSHRAADRGELVEVGEAFDQVLAKLRNNPSSAAA